MIRPYLRDLINKHKPIDELNDESNDDDTDRAEWKIQLTTQNSCISTKSFEETCTIYKKSEPLEMFMGSDTAYVIDKHFLIHFYKDFNMHQKYQMIEEAKLFLKVLNYYIIMFKE